MVSIGGIVIDLELTVVSILDGVGYDFCCRIIVRDHPPGAVNDGSGKRETMHCADRFRFCAVTLIH